jgi:hypothetical protein
MLTSALGFLILQFLAVMVIIIKKRLLLELWNSLVCLRLAQFWVLVLKGLWFKLDGWKFDFSAILAQITNNFLKVQQNQKIF